MSKLAELFVIIGADDSKFRKVMDGIGKSGKDLVAKFRTIEKAAAIMGTALVGAMAAIVYKTAKAEDEMGHLSQTVGINVKILSSLKLAAETSGTSLEEMAFGLGTLARRMVEGNKIFKEMGLEIRKTNGAFKTVDEMLFEISDKFIKTSDATKKLAWSQELLGKSGKNMKEFLEMGPEALRNWMKEAERLGIVIDEKMVEKSKEFMDNLKKLQAAITGITRVFANELIPIFSKVFVIAADKLIEARDRMDLAKWAKSTALGVINAFGAIIDMAYGLAMTFNVLKAVIFVWAQAVAEVIGNIIIGYSKFLGLIGKIPGLGVYKGVAAAWESWGRTAIVIADSYGEEINRLDNELFNLAQTQEKVKKGLQDFKIAIDEGDKSTKKIKKSFQDLLPPAKDFGKALELGAGEYEENIFKLEALNADYLDIVKKNTMTEFNYRREGLKKWYEEEKQKLSDVYGRTEEFYKKKLELDKAYQSELEKILKDEKKAWFDNLYAVMDAVANVFSQIGALADTSAQNKIALIDEEYQKQKEAIDNSLISDEAKYAAMERLDREYEIKKRAIQKEAFEFQKKISLATAAINIAEAITKALTGAIPPWSFILAGLAAAAGAIQLATIAAQKFPEAQKGGFVEREGLVRVHTGERIYPQEYRPAVIQQNLQLAPAYVLPSGRPVINLNIYARTLDRDTVDKAAELIYDAMGRQRRRRM
jgi:hypothetical protein